MSPKDKYSEEGELFALISAGNVEGLEAALKAGADPNQTGAYETTPISRVVYNRTKNQLLMLELLIEYGANVNVRRSSDGEPLVHSAGTVEVASLLAKNGADLTLTSSTGETPLHSVDNAELAQFFIDQGVDVNARDNSGSPPLIDAVYETPELVACLLKNGGDAAAKNQEGQTALIRLADNDFALDNDELLQIAELLLRAGTPIDATDKNGLSAAECARRASNPRLASFLDDAAARTI